MSKHKKFKMDWRTRLEKALKGIPYEGAVTGWIQDAKKMATRRKRRQERSYEKEEE